MTSFEAIAHCAWTFMHTYDLLCNSCVFDVIFNSYVLLSYSAKYIPKTLSNFWKANQLFAQIFQRSPQDEIPLDRHN